MVKSETQSPITMTPRDSKYRIQDEDEKELENMSTPMRIARGLMYGVLSLAALYLFLVAVNLIGASFMLMLGCKAKSAFDFADNPVAGLMVGTVVTSLVQSSSTTTSITVSLVGAGALSVRQAVPVIMGANIGTCVTSTMVAFGQVSSLEQFERAMAGATVHDMYNILTVALLLPIEALFHPLEKIGVALSDAQGGSGMFKSFVSTAVKAVSNEILSADKKAVEKIAKGNGTCDGSISLIKSGVFKDSSMSDTAVGVIVLCIGLVLLVIALMALVRMLSKLFLGATRRAVSKVLNYNGYLNIVVGALVTFLVQSSSITTSTVTPLAGLGVVTLEQVYPLVLGANLGTTTTALIAALSTGKSTAMAIALVHFCFNLFGILIFYPIPYMRRPVLAMARGLAYSSACWPVCALAFILMVFIGAPGLLVGLVALCTSSSTTAAVFGWILVVALALCGVGFVFWYLKKGGQERWLGFLEKKRSEREATINNGAEATGVDAV